MIRKKCTILSTKNSRTIRLCYKLSRINRHKVTRTWWLCRKNSSSTINSTPIWPSSTYKRSKIISLKSTMICFLFWRIIRTKSYTTMTTMKTCIYIMSISRIKSTSKSIMLCSKKVWIMRSKKWCIFTIIKRIIYCITSMKIRKNKTTICCMITCFICAIYCLISCCSWTKISKISCILSSSICRKIRKTSHF